MAAKDEMNLAKAQDRHRELDDQLYENERKLSKCQENIKQGLDVTGQVERRAQELTEKIATQKEALQKSAEIIAILETKV